MLIANIAPTYLIYGVPNWQDVNIILARGYLEANSNGYIPTKLLFQNIPRENKQSIFDYGYIFILDTKLLKKDKFKIVTPLNYMGYGMGNLKRMPDMNVLISDINKFVKSSTDPSSYLLSHDIFFTKNIDLHKYCKFLIINTNIDADEYMNQFSYTINAAHNLGISVAFNGKDSGLNNLFALLQYAQ